MLSASRSNATTVAGVPPSRSSRRPCRRCGRAAAPDGTGLCRACDSVDLARCGGLRSFDYSPFRPLTAPA